MRLADPALGAVAKSHGVAGDGCRFLVRDEDSLLGSPITAECLGLASDDIADREGPGFIVGWLSRQQVEIVAEVFGLNRAPDGHVFVQQADVNGCDDALVCHDQHRSTIAVFHWSVSVSIAQ
jgi:hypothetical protein